MFTALYNPSYNENNQFKSQEQVCWKYFSVTPKEQFKSFCPSLSYYVKKEKKGIQFLFSGINIGHGSLVCISWKQKNGKYPKKPKFK